MAETTIQKGWLTDFNDQLFAPYTVSDLVLMKTSGEKLDTYIESRFSGTTATINNTKLLVDLTSDEAGTFKAGSSDTPVNLGVSGILDVPNGGTGQSSLTANHILYGNGTGKVNLLAPAAGILAAEGSDKTPAYVSLTGTWTEGSTAGPVLNIKIGELTYSTAAIPIATAKASGIVTMEEQTFGGLKSFANGVAIANGLTVTGNINISGGNIINVGKPTDDAHAANKQYVDGIDSALSGRIDKLVNVIGDNGDQTPDFTHESRIDSLESYQAGHTSEFNTLRTYINYDAFGDALYIIGGKNENGDTIVSGTESTTAPVYAYFNNSGIHAIDLTVDGTTFSGITSRVGTTEGNIDIIFNILGEEAYNTEKGSHFTRLNSIDTQIAGLSGTLTATKTELEGKITEEAEARELKDLEIEGWISELQDKDIAIEGNLDTIFDILGETSVSTNHITRFTNLQTALEKEISDRKDAITALHNDILDDTLVVDFATSGATAISTGKIGISGTLAVGSGGTGTTTFTTNGILLGNGTSALKQVTTSSGLLIKNANNVPEFGGRLWCGWNSGTTAGPTLNYTLKLGDTTNDYYSDSVAIPSASDSNSGVVTTGTQTFGGTKTFKNTLIALDALSVTGNITTSSDLSVTGNFSTGFVNSNLLPNGDRYIGNPTNSWKGIYSQNLVVKDPNGTGYLQIGVADQSGENNFRIESANQLILKGSAIYLNATDSIILPSSCYGPSLPTEGMVEGQIFFLLTS